MRAVIWDVAAAFPFSEKIRSFSMMRIGLTILLSVMNHRQALLIGMLVLPLIMIGQVNIHYGSSFPTDPAPHTWHFNPQSHALWTFEHGKWEAYKGDAPDSAYACGPLIIFHSSMLEFAINGLQDIHLYVDQKYCADSMALVVSGSYAYTFDPTGEWIGSRYVLPKWPILPPITIQGMDAFSVQRAVPVLLKNRIDGEHLWGVFGSNGQWLIEPVYSDPITFKNGVAKVTYYGERRKINEYGEFLK